MYTSREFRVKSGFPIDYRPRVISPNSRKDEVKYRVICSLSYLPQLLLLFLATIPLFLLTLFLLCLVITNSSSILLSVLLQALCPGV